MVSRIDGTRPLDAIAGRWKRIGPPTASDAPRVERVEAVGDDAADEAPDGPAYRGRERRRDPRARSAWRPHAPLVAQLIATALGFSQTRARRRATIDEALAAYTRGDGDTTTPRGAA